MKPKPGDFVIATVQLNEIFPTRQGIFRGDGTILGESGAVYPIERVVAIVTDLDGSTLEFVENWRRENLDQ